jgi:hypothetical protein
MKRFLTITLLVSVLAGCAAGRTVVPYYGATMNEKLLPNGVGTTCTLEPPQAFRSGESVAGSPSDKVVLYSITITKTTILQNGQSFTATCVLTPKEPAK